MHFTIVGAGALGTILGAHLIHAGHPVRMLARGARAAAIAHDGLRVRGLVDLSVPCEVVTAADPARDDSVLVFAVKTYHMVDAIAATGATDLQILRYGVLPQVLPLFLSYVLYRLETNIRAATVLGFVGAGGIGFYLQTYLRMIDYPAASTVLLVTVAMVMAVDALSSRLRARLV